MKKILIVCILAVVTVTAFVSCQATKDYGKAIGGSVSGLGKDIGHSFKDAFK